MKRPLALFLLPALAMALWVIAPLAAGSRTLFLRDVFNTHLPMRIGLGRALRAGELPLVDPLRAGGQGLLGNPNAVPLYPDNLLLLVTTDLWQLNAHFWLHWLLAFAGMYALARVWRLGPEASASAAAIYAFSGYFLSQLNLYNAVAGAALAPALAAALLAVADGRHRRVAIPTLGAIWALELLAGDPILGGVALLGAALLGLSDDRRPRHWAQVAIAIGAGTLLAAPQWIETLRLLPGSQRGFWGQQSGAMGSPDPRAFVELLLPLGLGRLDRAGFWGLDVFGGTPPLYGSLAPGLLALGLAFSGLRRGARRERRLAIVLVVGLALSFAGPLVASTLQRLPNGELFRFPVKFVLIAMLAASLAAGRGVERWLVESDRGRDLFRVFALLVVVESATLLLVIAPGSGFATLVTRLAGDAGDSLPLLRGAWLAAGLKQLVLLAGGVAVLVWVRRWPRLGAGLLVTIHVAGQLWLLAPLVATDAAAPYLVPPPLLAEIPPDAVTSHGCLRGLFCSPNLDASVSSDDPVVTRVRRAYDELYSFALFAGGRRGELQLSPEGLDAFPVAATASAIRRVGDPEKLRILAAMGVDRLIVDRPLDPASAGAVLPLSVGIGSPATRIYEVVDALPDVALLGRVRRAPNMNDAFSVVVSPGFDPRLETVVSGSGAILDGPPGVVQGFRLTADEIEMKVDSIVGGAVVVRRAWLSIWRAEVDGVAAPVRIANLNRLAVEVPPGRHVVRFFVSRRPFVAGLAAALLGGLVLLLPALRSGALVETTAGESGQ